MPGGQRIADDLPVSLRLQPGRLALPYRVEDGQVVSGGQVPALGLQRGHLGAVPLDDVGQDGDRLARFRAALIDRKAPSPSGDGEVM